MMKELLAIVACLLCAFPSAKGHGRFLEPPSRSSVWRFPDDPAIEPYMSIVDPNVNDNELFCGGAQHQKNLGGKCGVCGDAWDAEVKENEAGGTYAKGIIVRQYSPGSTVEVTIEITAHHKGYFEFRLCPWDNPTLPITHECLNQNLLEILNDGGDTKWYLTTSNGGIQKYYLKVKLPDSVECDQCVMQWRYHTGNTWDCDDDGHCCTGCGPQEEFYGCADIAIGTGSTLPPPGFQQGSTIPSTKETTTQKATTTKSTTTSKITTTPAPTTTVEVDPNNPCPGAGSGYHLHDCYTFFVCNGSDQILYDCPPGTAYDESRNICDYSYNVPPPCGTKV